MEQYNAYQYAKILLNKNMQIRDLLWLQLFGSAVASMPLLCYKYLRDTASFYFTALWVMQGKPSSLWFHSVALLVKESREFGPTHLGSVRLRKSAVGSEVTWHFWRRLCVSPWPNWKPLISYHCLTFKKRNRETNLLKQISHCYFPFPTPHYRLPWKWSSKGRKRYLTTEQETQVSVEPKHSLHGMFEEETEVQEWGLWK